MQNGDGSYSYTDPAGNVRAFNSAGLQTAWTTADGFTKWGFSYNAANAVAVITAPDNAVSSFSYTSGLLSSIAVAQSSGGPVKKGKKKGVGSRYGHPSTDSFFGRPGGRNVASKPKQRAVRSVHHPAPKGRPRATERRSASNSPSVSTPLTCSTQSAGKANGISQQADRLPFLRLKQDFLKGGVIPVFLEKRGTTDGPIQRVVDVTAGIAA